MDTTAAQFAADFQTILLWQKNIQNDQIIRRQFGYILSLLPIISSIDAIALMCQIHLERTVEAVVIFNDKDTHSESSLLVLFFQKPFSMFFSRFFNDCIQVFLWLCELD